MGRGFQSAGGQPFGEPGQSFGELELIRRIRARCGAMVSAGGSSAPGGVSGGRIPLGIGDDCALLRPCAGEDLAVTTDLSIDGRHFHLGWHPPEAIGHRALARGLSDLAAMGARPLAAFLSLGLPGELARDPDSRNIGALRCAGRKGVSGAGAKPALPSASWLDRFFDGFLALAGAAGAPLAGGDLAECSILIADVVLVGAVRRSRALLRCGARPGDLLYVTGALGGAASGLAMLAEFAAQRSRQQRQSTARGQRAVAARIPRRFEPALAAHLYPQPRLKQGQWLAAHRAASAAIDISDGLSTDLAHLCEESGVAADIEAARLPFCPGASLEQTLHGGEDYELLFTAAPEMRMPRSIAGVPVTRIGRIVRQGARRPPIVLVTDHNRQPLSPRGWQHFTGR